MCAWVSTAEDRVSKQADAGAASRHGLTTALRHKACTHHRSLSPSHMHNQPQFWSTACPCACSTSADKPHVSSYLTVRQNATFSKSPMLQH